MRSLAKEICLVSGQIGNKRAICKALGIARATFYRACIPVSPKEPRPRWKPPRALSEAEKQVVADILNGDRFGDKAPTEVFATLLDEGHYYCSPRTMYRILEERQEIRERRDVLCHPKYQKPELLATAPNQVWSWDITKLKGPAKWSYFYLYVIIDIYSRHVVGWLVAPRENAELAKHLISETFYKQRIETDELVIHSDRGAAMTSKTVAYLMADLGVTKSLNRPHVSNDNPYSESQFKTLKYQPSFPKNFGSIEDANSFCKGFFHWYNNVHHHSGIALMTPATVHYGFAKECASRRQVVLTKAYGSHPERFVAGPPKTLVLPEAAWINPPKPAINEFDDTKSSGIIIGSVR